MVFPETALKEAAGIVERFRVELASQPLPVGDATTQLNISVSGGVAEFEPGDSLELLVAREHVMIPPFVVP